MTATAPTAGEFWRPIVGLNVRVRRLVSAPVVVLVFFVVVARVRGGTPLARALPRKAAPGLADDTLAAPHFVVRNRIRFGAHALVIRAHCLDSGLVYLTIAGWWWWCGAASSKDSDTEGGN